jgi:Thioredoxin
MSVLYKLDIIESCHPHVMQDFLFWFGVVANSITVFAGLIAIAGVVWAFLGRARLAVTTQFFLPSVAPSLTIGVASVGSNPVRGLELNFGLLDDNGFSMMGDGLVARPALSRGETVTVIGYEPDETSFGSAPRDGEFRFEIGPGEGWYLNLQWQSPLFPWRRSSRTFAWPPARRFACDLPQELAGRKEISFLKRTRDPSLNPSSPSYAAPLGVQTRATMATDGTFDDLLAGQKGPVFVGFGPTWQGKWWEDVKRVLDAFAAKHAPRVKVLVVNIDECPNLAQRFTTNEVPVFKMLLKSKVAKSYTGAHAFPDLEREFAEFLG